MRAIALDALLWVPSDYSAGYFRCHPITVNATSLMLAPMLVGSFGIIRFVFSSPRAGTNNTIYGDMRPAMFSEGDSEFDGPLR